MNFYALSSIMSVWTFKALSIIEALSVSYSGSNAKGSTTYRIKCEITGFSSLASWTRNETSMVQCQSSGCLYSGDQRYIFGYDAGAIYADFVTLATNEEGITWTCAHAGDTPAPFTVDVSFRLSMRAIGNNKMSSTTYFLECEIPGFSNQSVWKKGGNQLSTCTNTGCSTESIQVYSFRHDASATYVDFHTLEASEDDIQWTCEHAGDVTAHFKVQLDFENKVITACALSMGIIIVVMVIVAKLFKPEYVSYPSIKHDVFRGTLRNSLQVIIVAAVVQFVGILSTLIFLNVYKDMYEDYEIRLILIFLPVCPILGVWIYLICDIYCCRKCQSREIGKENQPKVRYEKNQQMTTEELSLGGHDVSLRNQLEAGGSKDQLKTIEEGYPTDEINRHKIRENIKTFLLVTVISAFMCLVLLILLVLFCCTVIKDKVSGTKNENTEEDSKGNGSKIKNKKRNTIEQKKHEGTGNENPSGIPNEAAT